MKLQYICNSGCIVYLDTGTKILIDPWITDGIYLGSWIHSPALKYQYQNLELSEDDLMYISHVHSDHLDIKFLDHINKNISVILHKDKGGFAKRVLKSIGFNHFIELESTEKAEFKDKNLCLTMFGPFTKHPFEIDTKLGNIIDSSCLFTSGNQSFLHVNDNKLNEDSVKKFNLEGMSPDCVLINYNPAGPYPSCFKNFNAKDKIKISREVGLKCLNNTIKSLKLINPKYVIPTSGNYKINEELDKGGKITKSLGHIDIQEANDLVNSHGLKSIIIRESQMLNLESGELTSNLNSTKIKKMDNSKKIPYFKEPYLNKKDLIPIIHKARDLMKNRWDKYGGGDVKTNIVLEIDNSNEIVLSEGNASFCELRISMDLRLLRNIINRKAFFDDAQIGCHITFSRIPNIYEYDAMTMLQFLHL